MFKIDVDYFTNCVWIAFLLLFEFFLWNSIFDIIWFRSWHVHICIDINVLKPFGHIGTTSNNWRERWKKMRNTESHSSSYLKNVLTLKESDKKQQTGSRSTKHKSIETEIESTSERSEPTATAAKEKRERGKKMEN